MIDAKTLILKTIFHFRFVKLAALFRNFPKANKDRDATKV
jgi:hypothetical protein